MLFVACGLNHKTAPLNVREKISFSLSRQDELLHNLVNLTPVNEAAILSTCNRTEIYCHTEEPEHVVSWLANQHQLAPEKLLPHLYVHHGYHGIRHTLRVASGLDSMMLGEPQIFGQMKQAYQHACRLGTVKRDLRSVFQYVFRASKRIRHHSGIGNNPVSVAYAAVQLIAKRFPSLHKLKVFIIGSGETSSLVAKYLHEQGAKHFFMVSRTSEKAEQFAMNFNGKSLTINDIPQFLSKADVVISATACPLPFINKNMVQQALIQRNHSPMFLLDLAVPRDIEPDVAELDNVHLYNIDDLHVMIERGKDERRQAAIQAEQLIETELNQFIRWHRSLKAKNLICDYRAHMHELAKQELQRAESKLSSGQDQSIVLREFCDRLVRKLMHHPTVALRQVALDDREELLDLVHYLYDFSGASVS